MRPDGKTYVLLGVALALGLAWPSVGRGASPGASRATDDDDRIVHALNRLTFGPRPGDVEQVKRVGLQTWIDRQLHPERVPQAGELLRGLESLPTQRLSTTELLKRYEIPPGAKREVQQQLAKMDTNGMDAEAAQRQKRQEIAKRYADLDGTPRQVLGETQEAKLLRAVYSERQLEEVMADFWFNHFNVFADKGPEKLLIPEYERETIRPRVLGHFEDLLLATAQSPAMLFYLDNWLSVDPNAPKRVQERREMARLRNQAWQRYGHGRPPLGPPMIDDPTRNNAGPRRTGLNENYAREIMELHTLGVDGGYTQKDVTEVARCFTGWTIEGLKEQNPRFRFVPMLHDPGDKLVLGTTIKGAGEAEGRHVIHLLATHAATAGFIATKLARRFVADDPPPALVERAAKEFRKSDGDIREVLRVLFDSPEFWGAQKAKIKTPFEFVVSAARASGARVDDARGLARRIAEMGMPLFLQQPPTGYKDTADAWVSTGGLLARLNFSLDLAAGRVRGVSTDFAALAPDAGDGVALADTMAARLVPSGLSDATRRTLSEKSGGSLEATRVAGLILGSPEFQRR